MSWVVAALAAGWPAPAAAQSAAAAARPLTSAVAAAVAPQPAPPPAADPPLPYPAGLSMPVRLIGIDPEESAPARAALVAAEQAVAAAWLRAPTSLTAFLGSRRAVGITAKKLADRILTGTPRTAAALPLAVETAWCSVMDRHVFIVTVADAQRNALLASRHAALPRVAWAALGKRPGAQAAYLARTLPPLVSAALQAAAAAAARPAADALHIGLSLGQAMERRDEGTGLCVDLLLEEQLAGEYTVARQLGGDHLALARELLRQPPVLRRPTRQLVLRWSSAAPRRALPVRLALTATLADAVFGKHLAPSFSGGWDVLDGPGATLAVSVPPAFKRLLDDERAALRLADWPQVAKVDRAWVYLDRGRAWGLKMNDRLVAEVNGRAVKGHVVHFFGPEAGVTSPRGFAVREGAVLYIRQNQRLPRIGLEFRMDPRTFPAPYPPLPQVAAGNSK